MHIHVNGETRRVREELNVTGLLQDLQLNADRVAVEINLEILDRGDFDARRLEEGDRIEIMSFIGGGACLLAGPVGRNAAQSACP